MGFTDIIKSVQEKRIIAKAKDIDNKGIVEIFPQTNIVLNRGESYLAENMLKVDAKRILDKEAEDFFPASGALNICCYKKPKGLTMENLPCHLYDKEWLSRIWSTRLIEKGIHIHPSVIYVYLMSYNKFSEFRKQYENAIVSWQIDQMLLNTNQSILPKGFNGTDINFGEDCDICFRASVVETLTTIGLNQKAVERALELNSDKWRKRLMMRAFDNKYERIYSPEVPESDAELRNKWLKLREYRYYHAHKEIIDDICSPNILAKGMLMSAEEYYDMKDEVEVLGSQRLAELELYDEKYPFSKCI